MRFNVETKIIDKEECLILTPVDKLADSEYDRLKPYIEVMGGHWREKVSGFVFIKKHIKKTNKLNWQEAWQYFPTPKSVAERVIQLSEIEEYKGTARILEPSAGTGNLLDCIPNSVEYTAFVVEPEENNAIILEDKGFNVYKDTFERFYNEYKDIDTGITHVIMNPPFSIGRDMSHTRLAYEMLQRGGVLVSIISENSLYYDKEETKQFNKWLKEVNAYIETVPMGAFKDSGTTIDTVIIKIKK